MQFYTMERLQAFFCQVGCVAVLLAHWSDVFVGGGLANEEGYQWK